MKKCPFCAEQIQDEAIKCRYCEEYLTDISIQPEITKKPNINEQKAVEGENKRKQLKDNAINGSVIDVSEDTANLETLEQSDTCVGRKKVRYVLSIIFLVGIIMTITIGFMRYFNPKPSAYRETSDINTNTVPKVTGLVLFQSAQQVITGAKAKIEGLTAKSKDVKPKITVYKIRLRNGREIVGNITKETQSEVTVNVRMAGGYSGITGVFQKMDIASMERLEAIEEAKALLTNTVVSVVNKPSQVETKTTNKEATITDKVPYSADNTKYGTGLDDYITGADDGYQWIKTCYEAKMNLCRDIAMRIGRRDAQFYYDALEAFYSSRNPYNMKMTIAKVAGLVSVMPDGLDVEDDNSDKEYVCAADEVTMDEPGKCPVCGRNLVEVLRSESDTEAR